MSPELAPCPFPALSRRRRPRAAHPLPPRPRTGWRLPSPSPATAAGTTRPPALVRTPPQHAARPKILLQLQERVRTYFDDPKVLPSLNAANGSPRQQRSERREACLDLLGALVHYLDLATLRVGIPQADGSIKDCR